MGKICFNFIIKTLGCFTINFGHNSPIVLVFSLLLWLGKCLLGGIFLLPWARVSIKYMKYEFLIYLSSTTYWVVHWYIKHIRYMTLEPTYLSKSKRHLWRVLLKNKVKVLDIYFKYKQSTGNCMWTGSNPARLPETSSFPQSSFYNFLIKFEFLQFFGWVL